MTASKNNIGEMTTAEVSEAISRGIDTVVFPVGSMEQHGPHGVIGTDAYLAQVVAEKVAMKLDVLLAPLMPYGLSSSHMNFKGTMSISPEAFGLVCEGVLRSLIHHGFKKIIIINGNEPNYYPLIMVARTIREETSTLITISNWYGALQEIWKELPGIKGTPRAGWKWPFFMAHGGLLETSGSMAYKDGIVRLDLATTYGSEKRETIANPVVSLPARIDEFTKEGCYGDPRDSTAALGENWTDIAADRIIERVNAAWKAAGETP